MTRSKFPLVTASYAVVLLGTTITLAVVPSPTHDHLLAGSSTDVIHLRRDPLLVLLASLFWLPNDMSIALAPLVVLVLFVAERRFGAVRLIAAFVAGHVAATLLTEGWVWWAVDAGLLGHGHEHRIDVGPSYGTCALIGLLVAALSSRQRMLGWPSPGHSPRPRHPLRTCRGSQVPVTRCNRDPAESTPHPPSDPHRAPRPRAHEPRHCVVAT